MASGSTSVAFVTELNSTGTALNYSTYLGGSGDANGNGDAGAGIAVDSSNNTYVTGQTFSSNFPTTPGAFQTSNNDASRGTAFVTELNSTGTALNYSTYLGGSGGLCGGDAGYGITVHSSGIPYVTGQTCSTDFPTTAGAFDTVNNGAPNEHKRHQRRIRDGTHYRCNRHRHGNSNCDRDRNRYSH